LTVNNKIYPLENNKNISQAQILLFESNIVSEYDKNLDWNRPEIKQLYHLFVLNGSFNTTILLSYYGSIGFVIQKSNNTNCSVTFNYLKQNGRGSIFGLPFQQGDYLNNIRFYGPYDYYNYRYAYISNVSDLTLSTSIDLARDYLDLDYMRYYEEKAKLEQIEASKLEELNKSGEEFIRAYQSGDAVEKIDVKNRFRALSERLGIAEPIAKKNFEVRINQTSESGFRVFKNWFLNQLWFIILAPISLFILSKCFIEYVKWKNKPGKQNCSEIVDYVTLGIGVVMVILPYVILLLIGDITLFRVGYIFIWMIIIGYLDTKKLKNLINSKKDKEKNCKYIQIR